MPPYPSKKEIKSHPEILKNNWQLETFKKGKWNWVCKLKKLMDTKYRILISQNIDGIKNFSLQQKFSKLSLNVEDETLWKTIPLNIDLIKLLEEAHLKHGTSDAEAHSRHSVMIKKINDKGYCWNGRIGERSIML